MPRRKSSTPATPHTRAVKPPPAVSTREKPKPPPKPPWPQTLKTPVPPAPPEPVELDREPPPAPRLKLEPAKDRVTVILMDIDRTKETVREIPITDRHGTRIYCDGATWVHLDEAADGTWRYVRI